MRQNQSCAGAPGMRGEFLADSRRHFLCIYKHIRVWGGVWILCKGIWEYMDVHCTDAHSMCCYTTCLSYSVYLDFLLC